MIRHIDSWKDFSFLAGTLSLIDRHNWNSGEDLRKLAKAKRRELRAARYAFDGTIHSACGIQDAYGDRCERIGEEYMQMVHAYLACRYGKLTRRLTEIMENSLPEWTESDQKAVQS